MIDVPKGASRVLRGWLVTLSLALGFAAAAQQPALRVYSIQDGLGFSQVFCVFQDRRGFVWAGTSYGVSRYDGREFRTLTKAHGLPHDSVREISEDGSGTLWVLTQEGLAQISATGGPEGAPEVLRRDPSLDAINGSHLRRMAFAGPVLWLLGTEGLFRVEGQDVRRIPLPEGLRLADPLSLGPVGREEAWLSTPDAVVRFQPGSGASLSRHPPELGPPVALLRGSFGTLLLQKEGISRLSGTEFVPALDWALPRGLNPSGFTPFGDGLCVSTPARGLLLLDSRSGPRVLSREQGLPSNTVHGALVDRDGLLWLATEDGLVKVFDFDVLSHLSRPPGIGAMVLSFAEDAAGRILIGHSDGLTRLSGNGYERFDPFPSGTEESSVWSVLPLSDGTVLLATKSGLVALREDRFFRFPGLAGAGRGRVFSLVASPDGALWIGTDGNGVFRWDRNALDHFGPESGLSTGVCRSVLGVSRDEALIGTDSGLFRLVEGRATADGTFNRRFDRPYVVALLRTPEGFSWAALTDRIVELRDGAIGRVVDRSLGLAGTSTTAENCLYRSSRGELWTGMVGGASRIQLVPRRSKASPPDVMLLGVFDTQGRTVADLAGLPHEQNSLTFAFRSPTFLAEERTRFQERLRGYDADWSPPHVSASVRYTNLPAGAYTFEVRALSASGLRSKPALFRFAVAAPWWQTVWARLAFLAALFLLGYAAVALRTRRLRAHAETLRKRVSEKTRELADANERLEDAHRHLARLLETGVHAHEEMERWTKEAAQELAPLIQARRIRVHFLVDDIASSPDGPLSPFLEARALGQLSSGVERVDVGATFLFPIRGAASDLVGVLVVEGHDSDWEETERRLVTALAHQIGGALELRRMQKRLEKAATARQALHRDLQEKGVATAVFCPGCGRCFSQGDLDCPEDGSRLEPIGLLPFRLANRYQLRRLLGQGGMGMVFLASDEQLGREVAIKIIRPERFDDPGLRLRFDREARATARIQHRGVISIFDFGQLGDGSAFLVMERLRGLDLATVLARHGRGNAEQVASLAVQSAAGLTAAHEAKVVHRDLKPANLFLVPDPDGFVVKVVDFGLARSFVSGEALTKTGIVVGTPAYMSPEQVRGEPVTRKSDVYALAVTLREALTGTALVKSRILSETFTEILSAPPPPISSVRPGFPSEVDEVFGLALRKDPALRIANALAWAETLAEVLRRIRDRESGWPASLLMSPEEEVLPPGFDTGGTRAIRQFS